MAQLGVGWLKVDRCGIVHPTVDIVSAQMIAQGISLGMLDGVYVPDGIRPVGRRGTRQASNAEFGGGITRYCRAARQPAFDKISAFAAVKGSLATSKAVPPTSRPISRATTHRRTADVAGASNSAGVPSRTFAASHLTMRPASEAGTYSGGGTGFPHRRLARTMKRVKAEPEFTLIGGLLRFETMARVISDQLQSRVNVPDEDTVQFVAALGAAILGHRRLQQQKEMNVTTAV